MTGLAEDTVGTGAEERDGKSEWVLEMTRPFTLPTLIPLIEE